MYLSTLHGIREKTKKIRLKEDVVIIIIIITAQLLFDTGKLHHISFSKNSQYFIHMIMNSKHVKLRDTYLLSWRVGCRKGKN